MGNTYFIHTEAKIDDAWRCIDGYYMHKPYGKDKEGLTLFTTYENGSRSSFGEAYEKLCEIGHEVKFSNLSKEVRKAHPGLKYLYDFCNNDEKKEESCYPVVELATFNAHVPKGYANHGIIHKDYIEQFECGDRDVLWEDESVDFGKLSDLEKQVYQYYEWDEYNNWQYHFKHLKNRIDATVEKYINNEWIFEHLEVRIVAFCL